MEAYDVFAPFYDAVQDDQAQHTEDIREVAFPADRIRRSLQKRFRRIWTYDAERSRPSPSSGRLHFVCRK
jgi:hypothetical protein